MVSVIDAAAVAVAAAAPALGLFEASESQRSGLDSPQACWDDQAWTIKEDMIEKR